MTMNQHTSRRAVEQGGAPPPPEHPPERLPGRAVSAAGLVTMLSVLAVASSASGQVVTADVRASLSDARSMRLMAEVVVAAARHLITAEHVHATVEAGPVPSGCATAAPMNRPGRCEALAAPPLAERLLDLPPPVI